MTPASAIGARPEGKAWHSQSAEEVLAQLASTAEGLSAQKAAQRLATDGPNELKEGKRISPLQIFLGQFKSLIIWILIVAGVISGLLGERVDAIAILAIVVLNAVIGFYQEFKAEKSIAALKKMTAPLLELATALLGCNNAHLVQEDGVWKTVGDPTEGALLAAGGKAGGDRKRIEKELPKQHEMPFDSDRKRSAVIRRMPDGKLRALINGAPDALLQLCTHLYTSSGIRPLTTPDRERILAQTSAMAQQALRVLGSANRDLDNASPADLTADAVEHDLVFVGLTGMYDPPRPEAEDAIAKCRAAGIRVVMITGDHPSTATAIAREIGLASKDDKAMAGVDLDKMSDEALRRRVPEVAVYARVTAEHKLRIIRALKANKAVVAMTGDGVNDTPAIKGADIGIAMGKSGTEVTKQAADMIITDDNFATIVAAIEEGRGIYDNIRKTLQYLLAGNTGELLFMTVCVVIGLPTPLLPIHLLWINLVTDGLPALCLATDPIDPAVMQRQPRCRSERMTNRSFLGTMLFTGCLTAGVTFAVYVYVLKVVRHALWRRKRDEPLCKE